MHGQKGLVNGVQWFSGIAASVLGILVATGIVAEVRSSSAQDAKLSQIATNVEWIKSQLPAYYLTSNALEVHRRLEQQDSQFARDISSLDARVTILERKNQ